jgi:uncharacterized protein (DUF1810 family)
MQAGAKQHHWMWYIFPQHRGLGHSHMAVYYGIADAAEAVGYLRHPMLGPRLAEITACVRNQLTTIDAHILMGSHIDMLKLASCMQLFGDISAQIDDATEPWIATLRHDCPQVIQLLQDQGHMPSA